MTIAEDILARNLLPTHLSSAEIRAHWSQRIREQALFSARTTQESYLRTLQRVLARVVSGEINGAKAEELLLAQLDALGYDPTAGGFPGDAGIPPAEPGSLRDLSSRMRIRLVVETNEGIGDSLANLARSQDPAVMELEPGWELIPGRHRHRPRTDWSARWHAAGNSVNWIGASRTSLAALKSSPIWQALGEGAGGYTDTLANPYPPFAFNSGLTWVGLDRAECIALGLITEEQA